jgi:hypothetical protein
VNDYYQVFKYRLNIVAFVCFFIGISAVQISYIFDGIRFLDLGVLLLIPAFLFFIIWLLQEWTSESKDYCVGLTILAFAVVIALLLKYKFQVGTIDDTYHTGKIIAYSIKNSFYTKFQVVGGGSEGGRSLIDFIENIWGLAWRFIHWDYIIVLIQILPVFILWRQLVEFFRNRKFDQFSGFLSAIIILNMQIIWAQACSTFIDSVTGIIAAVTLLKIADLLSLPKSRSFYNIMTTAFLSALCLLPKPILIPLSVFGLSVSFWFALTRLSKKEIFITVLTMLPSLGYFIKHYFCIWVRYGTLFYPWVGGGSPGSLATLPAGYYMGKHFFNFKPLYVFSSWLYDYRLGFVTPSPTADVGNGLLWTYLVVPILAIALIVSIFRIRQIKSFNPSVLILVFLVLFYYFVDGSVVGRYVLGFNIFIMAWALAWILGRIKNIGWARPLWFNMTAGCLALLLAGMSFFQAIKGAFLQYKVVSVLEAQRQVFPKYIDTFFFQERYCTMLLKDYKGQSVSYNVQSLINECEAKSYKQSPIGKDLKIRLQDYHFSSVLKNYENLKFMVNPKT